MSDSRDMETTFLFADLSGYSALTEAHGDEDAADLAEEFCHVVSGAVEGGGELVKTIGDAVMLRLDDPAEAVRLGLSIPHELWTGHGLPAAAVGIHHGTALERRSDWFGSTVNVAARLVGLAAGGAVLVSSFVKDAANSPSGISFEAQGDQMLRNLSSPVAVYAARHEGRPRLPIQVDPVCRMMVSSGRQSATLRHEGAEYRFCSRRCAERFSASPEVYLRHVTGGAASDDT